MFADNKPLYTLTIGEFIALTRQLVDEALKELQTKAEKPAGETEEHFNIGQLAAFLKCSKVSIHNYKRLGMPFYRIGRKILFKKSEVLNFMRGLKGRRRLA